MFLHIFGCNCFILNNRDSLGKFDPKADDGIFFGYSLISKAFCGFNKRRQTIEETIHVTFNKSRSANPNSYTENEKINQWANSYFNVPDTPIANSTSSERIPDDFEEQTAIPQDRC